jgi:hypothetical protein
LTPLCITLHSLELPVVLAGTAFSLLDRVCAAVNKPELIKRITNYPTYDEENVPALLGSFIDLSDCTIAPQQCQQLAGRFCFAIGVIQKLADRGDDDQWRKQAVLDKAIGDNLEQARRDLQEAVVKLLQFYKSRGI